MNFKSIGGAVIAVLVILLIFASFFTVNQNEMAVVTRFGELSPDSPDGSRRYHPRAWKSWRKHRFLLSPAARFTFSASDLASH